MKRPSPMATRETPAHSEHRALVVACVLVFALVFYAVFLFWEDRLEHPASAAIAEDKALVPIVHSPRAERETQADQPDSSDLHREAMSQDALSSQAVQFLLHQLQSGEQGIAVVGVSPQGLSAYLGLRNGDQITEINGQAVRSVDELEILLQDYHPKKLLQFKGQRDGQTMHWTYQAQADD